MNKATATTAVNNFIANLVNYLVFVNVSTALGGTTTAVTTAVSISPSP